MNVRITRLRDDIPLPEYQTEGAVAFDLSASERCVLPPKQVTHVPTGLIIATPPGYALILAPRSSLMKKTGLCLGNGIGIIDQDFCGPEDEIKLVMWNPTEAEVVVEKGDRLVQALFLPVERVAWTEGLTESKSRGGLGSTGGYTEGTI
jgi:dUTP pyrophosphatase